MGILQKKTDNVSFFERNIILKKKKFKRKKKRWLFKSKFYRKKLRTFFYSFRFLRRKKKIKRAKLTSLWQRRIIQRSGFTRAKFGGKFNYRGFLLKLNFRNFFKSYRYKRLSFKKKYSKVLVLLLWWRKKLIKRNLRFVKKIKVRSVRLRKFYIKKFKNFNNVLKIKHYYFRKPKWWKKPKRWFKPKKLKKVPRSIFLKKFFKKRSKKIKLSLFVSLHRRYLTRYLKKRFDFIRVRNRLFSRNRFGRLSFWRDMYSYGFRRARKQFIKKFRSLQYLRYKRFMYIYYMKYNFYRFFSDIIKYAKIRKRLKKYRKRFRSKEKRYVLKLRKDRIFQLNSFMVMVGFFNRKGFSRLSISTILKIFTLLKFKFKSNFLLSYLECLEKVRPLLIYKSMSISGKRYKIPITVPITKSYLIASKWLLNISLAEINSVDKVFENITSSINGIGPIIKHRKDHHMLMFENKSYIRFLRFLKKGF